MQPGLEHKGSGVGCEGSDALRMWDLNSLTRNITHVPCIARQILQLWTNGEVHTETLGT